MIAPQSDSAIVQRMAERALEDAQTVGMFLDAGCSREEAAALLNSEVK